MAYYVKSMKTLSEKDYRPEDISLQKHIKETIPTPSQRIGMPQQATFAGAHQLASFPTVNNSQIQSAAGLPVVQVPQAIPLPKVTPSEGSTPSLQQPMLLQSPKLEEGQRDQERRIRREIANSNERRRMQSINAGFKSLKTILPHTDGEKLSKAAILQQTSEYITQLEADKLKLLHQNEKLRRAFADCKCNSPKHRAIVTDIFDKDEGIGSPAEEDFEDMRRGMLEVRKQLDKERRMRLLAEEKLRTLEGQIDIGKMCQLKQKIKAGCSSDERRSSSDYSPSSSKSEGELFRTQVCARPLLPPLTPLVSKHAQADPAQVVISTVSSDTSAHHKTETSSLLVNTLNNQRNGGSVVPQLCNSDPPTESLTPSPKVSSARKTIQSQPVPITFFSHSTKSNQPLKKRAIEVHESFADAVQQEVPQQPKSKMAKICSDLDEPPEIGTRSFLPPSLPPISVTALQVPASLIHTLPLPADPSLISTSPNQKNKIETIRKDTQPQASSGLLQATNTPTTLSAPIQKTVSKSYARGCNSPPTDGSLGQSSADAVINTHPQRVIITNPSLFNLPTLSTTTSTIFCTTSKTGHLNYLAAPGPISTLSATSIKEIVARGTPPVVESTVPNSASPVYYTVGAMTPDPSATPVQPIMKQNLCVTLKPANTATQQLVMTPVSKQDQNLMIQDSRVWQTVPEASSSPAVRIAYGAALDNKRISTQLLNTPTNPPSILMQTPIVTAAESFTPIPHVFCYRAPELTLNQLNAVPNFPPPRSLHQPNTLPSNASLMPQLSSRSPSYSSPALQEPVLPARIMAYPAYAGEVRRRNSSFSATDSCSTASISGAEEEDTKNPLLEEPDSQSGNNVPTIKLCKKETPSKSSSRRKISQQSSNDHPVHDHPGPVGAEGTTEVEVPDSGPEKSKIDASATLSVPATLAGSPPVIRHIDAIQTRRNLETIVQAIDHLEQQERRNSQDQATSTPPAVEISK